MQLQQVRYNIYTVGITITVQNMLFFNILYDLFLSYKAYITSYHK